MNCNERLELTPLYLSGELDDARTLGLREHLAVCPACAADVERIEFVDSQMRNAILGETVDTAILDRRIRQKVGVRPARPWLRWMATAAALAVAVFGYRAFTAPDATCAAAALDHHREVVEAQPRRWVVEPVLNTVAVKQGIDEKVISRLSNAGFHLEHGKLCRLNGQVFLHLVYSNGSRYLSVFLRRDAGGPRDIKTADLGNDHTASLNTAEMSAIIVSDESSDAVVQVARIAQAVL